jgi:hypothetical protein
MLENCSFENPVLYAAHGEDSNKWRSLKKLPLAMEFH